MENQVNLTSDQLQSIDNYKRMGITIEVKGSDIIVKQDRLINAIILNQKELYDRGREIFPSKEYNIIPTVYSINLDEITIDWIKSKMEEFGIKRNDLIKQLGLDKTYISLLFSKEDNPRKINLSKPMKATFFYYFKYYELAQDFREYTKA